MSALSSDLEDNSIRIQDGIVNNHLEKENGTSAYVFWGFQIPFFTRRG
jgi:hypothetical protein